MSEEKTEKEMLKEISDKLDRVILAISLQGKDTTEKISILSQLNYKEKEIGQIVGLTPKAVNNLKYRKLGKGTKIKSKKK
jgi:hypothetical protein